MKKRFIILLSLFLFLISVYSCFAEQTQHTNTIYLSPFYRSNTIANINYNYTLDVSVPDGITDVSNALITFQVFYTPTVIFNLYVNDKVCNTPDYTISTTYASASQGRITFDCSNVIDKEGIYNVVLRANKNTGAINGYLELTYTNEKTSNMAFHGTEYLIGQDVKLWLQLLDENKTNIDYSICYIDIYKPDNTHYVSRAVMNNLNSDGLYVYDIFSPIIEGVYPALAECYYVATQDKRLSNAYTIQNGKLDAGILSNTYIDDSSYLSIETDKNSDLTLNNRINVTFEFNDVNTNCNNISELLFFGITIYWNGRWETTTNAHYINMMIYNYTSNEYMTLFNTIVGNGATEVTDSNSLMFNNITKALGITSTNPMKIRFGDVDFNEGAKKFKTDYLYVSCDSYGSPTWENVKGSSEIHINSNPFQNITIDLSDILYGIGIIQNNISQVIQQDNNILQLINLNYNEVLGVLNAMNSSMYQYYVNLQYQCNNNLAILSSQINVTDLMLYNMNNSINSHFNDIYLAIITTNQSNTERFTQIDNSLFYIIANITDLKNYMDARFITLENNLSSILSVIGNNHNEIMNYLSVMNSTIMQNYLSLDSQIQNRTLYLESRINQTDYYILSINQSNADNFGNIYNTLLSLNLTNENKFALIESYLLEINSSVLSLSNRVDSQYSNIQMNFSDVFSRINSNHNDLLSILQTINSSMYQNFEYLDSLTQNNTISILQSINQTDNYILLMNQSCRQNFDDIYSYLLLLNVSTQNRFDLVNNSLYEIYLNMSDLKSYMDERFNKIDNNISQILSVISLNHNEIVDYLSVMNSTMVQNFDYLNSLIINNTNLLMSQINTTDSYILSVNNSCNYHFETINDYLVSMNYNNTQRFELVNQSLYTIYSNMTDLQNYIALTYGNIQNNFTEIFGLINSNHNDVMVAITGMNQTINQINQTVTWNYQILLGLNQSVNDIWIWLITVLYPNVNSTNYNTQLILNKLNITLEEMNMNPITSNCIYGSNWVMNLLVTDNYGYVRTDVDCNITTDLWGQGVMAFDYPYYKYVHLCEPEGVIQWQITCEE